MLRRAATTEEQRRLAALRRARADAQDRVRRLRQLHRWAGPELDGLLATWRAAAREALDALRAHVRPPRGDGSASHWGDSADGPAAAQLTSRQVVRAVASLAERDALAVLGSDFFSDSDEPCDSDERPSDDDSVPKRARTDDW